MGLPKRASRLLSSICLLALAACSGGGGGGSASISTGTGNTTTGGSTTGGTTTGGTTTGGTTTTPTVSIGAPDKANVFIGGSSFNFTTSLPAVGTAFGLFGPAVKLTATSVAAAGTTLNSIATYRGFVTSNGVQVPVFDISIPEIGLTATNVHADGSTTTLADGSKVALNAAFLNYTEASAWVYAPGSGGVSYLGASAGGSGTPIANVPVAGTATYAGSGTTGGVTGAYFVPSGTGTITAGSLTGNVALSVNFSSGAVSGSLSNMTATPTGGGAATPWNTVNLTASINRLTNNASFIGTTATTDAPSGAGSAGFSSAATGGLGGAFFGPNANEVGGTFTLTDPNAAGGGKSAFGAFGATSTGCSGCSTSGTTTTTSGVSISAPGLGLASFGGSNVGTNFTTNLPPVGTVLPFGGSTVVLTPTSVANFTVGSIQATWRGTVTSGGLTWPVFDLSIPSLSINATNVHGDGTDAIQADGSKVNAKFTGLTYTLLGAWSYTPASGSTSYLGHVVTGYATPGANVPTSGSATYAGTGTVTGAYFVPAGTTAIQAGTLSGDASLTVNFGSNTANGSFTNMKATAIGSTTAAPWNDVTLSGTLSQTTGPGAFASVDGATTTTGNASAAGLSSAARGNFHGALYGPAAQEVGGTWSLSESTAAGGKAAFGVFGGK